MKKKFFLFWGLLLTATSCVTQKTITNNASIPSDGVYYTGNNEPAASAVSLENANEPECPVYYTGAEEPTASSGVVRYANEQ
jgi:hypothetical protein